MGFILTESRLEYETDSTSPDQQSSESLKISQLIPVVFILDANRTENQSSGPLIESEVWYRETCTSPKEFLSRSLEPAPSCLILHASDPGRGLDLQTLFAAQRPHVPIIFLCNEEDVATSVKAIKAGAVEFLTKPFQAEELLSAIREAHERSRFILAYDGEQRVLRKRYETLSQRERQVMALLVTGLLNKQVGFELGITEKTVKAHRGQVMHKMKAASFADLIRMATRLSVADHRDLHGLRQNDDHATGSVSQPFANYASAL